MRTWLATIILVAVSTGLFSCASRRDHPVQAPPPPPPPTAARPPAKDGTNLVATAHTLLVGNELEPPGFAMYSYLLLYSPPSDALQPLYLAAIRACLTRTENVADETTVLNAAELNLLLIPVKTTPSDDILKGPNLPQWVLDNYNYPRAQRLLAKLGDEHQGPYILSVSQKPLDVTQPFPAHSLLQDATGYDPKIIDSWFEHFLEQSRKEKFWEESSSEKFVLELRNFIANSANAAQLVIPAVTDAVKWLGN